MPGMNLENEISKAYIENNPLKSLVHSFGNASLEKWLEIGFGEALAKELDETSSIPYRDNSLFLDCLRVVNSEQQLVSVV